MAAPAEINIHNLNASFDMNKKIGDDTGPMLKMQGLPWLVRQAAAYSAVSINLKQYKGDDGIVHTDQEQISTGNMKQEEPRILDGNWAEKDIQFWGPVKGWNKFTKISELEDAWQKEDWLEEGEGDEKGDVLLSYTESLKNGWDATQVWGFAIVEGERRHVRKIISKKGAEVHKIRTVYDFKAAA